MKSIFLRTIVRGSVVGDAFIWGPFVESTFVRDHFILMPINLGSWSKVGQIKTR